MPRVLPLLMLLAFSCAAPSSPPAPRPPRTSALLTACAHGRAAEALALVAAATGDDLDAADVLGWTPLMLAAANETLAEVVEALVAAGARLDQVNVMRNISALHMACHKRVARAALLLVGAGARLDGLDARNKTALDYCELGGAPLAGAVAAIRARGGRTGEEVMAAAKASAAAAAATTTTTAAAATAAAAARGAEQEL